MLQRFGIECSWESWGLAKPAFSKAQRKPQSASIRIIIFRHQGGRKEEWSLTCAFIKEPSPTQTKNWVKVVAFLVLSARMYRIFR